MSDSDVLTDQELEARMIYAMVVAGKSAKFAEVVIRRILHWRGNGESPFGSIRRLHRQGSLMTELKKAKAGNYNKLYRGLKQLAHSSIALRICTPVALERIHGVGPKTSRFFILWTRPGYRCAALDVHILRWLRGLGHDAPKTTPPAGARYEALEQVFLAEADKRHLTPRELDFQIWETAAGRALPQEGEK